VNQPAPAAQGRPQAPGPETSLSQSRPRGGDPVLPDDAESLTGFEALLGYLQQSRGFDFSAYKRSSLMRRVLVRMQTLGKPSFGGYLDRLHADPEEFTRLFNTILINVTSFFRDAASWEMLRDDVIPDLIGSGDSTSPIRVWSAGCASGEEPYSAAILLAEALGPEAFRERVRIYATDVDEEALNQGRHATYSRRAVAEVPHALLERYFEPANDQLVISKELRRSVIFGRHNLIQDAPIYRINLVICRNCLMYFNSEAQTRMLAGFRFALVAGGVLFLGKAETLLAQGAAFEALDIHRRLFRKTDRHPGARDLMADLPRGADRPRHQRDAGELAPAARLPADRAGAGEELNGAG
jgi:two-component system CheB/CheR fusion protein